MLSMSNDLRYFKLHSEVNDPLRATRGSACFDLYSFLPVESTVKVYRSVNFEETETVKREVRQERIPINPNERVLVPTGLIFDIPVGYSIRLYPRSSLALKQGLTLANNVGIIDSDYVEPVFAMVMNVSGYVKYINHNERICQGELFKNQTCIIEEITERPGQKTGRTGGFGSTGKK